MGLKECLVECVTLCVKSEVMLVHTFAFATVVKKEVTIVKHVKMQKTTIAFAQLASLLAMPSMRWSSNMDHTFANVVKKEKNHAMV